MDLNKLFNLAEAEKIKVYDYCIDENINGIFLNYYKLNAIAINHQAIDNSQKEKEVLAEELRTLL